jgi:uncharacterized protein (DUF1330 family)
MAVERLVGLWVEDPEMYQKYREGMLPILRNHGGDFGYDFQVSEVLKSEVEAPINRVFTIYFQDEEALESFFSDPLYVAIRQKYFEPSVSAATVISKYDR